MGSFRTLTSTGCCFSCSPLSYLQAWDFPRAKIISVAQETPYYTVINFNFGALSHTLPMENWRQGMYYRYFIHWQRASHLLDHIFSLRTQYMEVAAYDMWNSPWRGRTPGTYTLGPVVLCLMQFSTSAQGSRAGSYQCHLRSPRNGVWRYILMFMTWSSVSNRNSWETQLPE